MMKEPRSTMTVMPRAGWRPVQCPGLRILGVVKASSTTHFTLSTNVKLSVASLIDYYLSCLWTLRTVMATQRLD